MQILDDDIRVMQLRAMRFLLLTGEEMANVENAFNDRNKYEVMTEIFGIQMTRGQMECLKPNGWINDEVSLTCRFILGSPYPLTH